MTFKKIICNTWITQTCLFLITIVLKLVSNWKVKCSSRPTYMYHQVQWKNPDPHPHPFTYKGVGMGGHISELKNWNFTSIESYPLWSWNIVLSFVQSILAMLRNIHPSIWMKFHFYATHYLLSQKTYRELPSMVMNHSLKFWTSTKI